MHASAKIILDIPVHKRSGALEDFFWMSFYSNSFEKPQKDVIKKDINEYIWNLVTR